MVSLITVTEALPDSLINNVGFNRGIKMKNKQLLTDLTDAQCEKVVGGVGRGGAGQGGGAGAGSNAWGAGTPFNPSGNPNAGLRKNFVPGENGNSNGTVFVPVKIA